MERTIYIVNALHWQYTDEWYAVQEDTPERAFTSRRDAERYRDRLEAEKQRELAETRHHAFIPHILRTISLAHSTKLLRSHRSYETKGAN